MGPIHQIGNDNDTQKQGYSLPVIPGTRHSCRLSLTGGNPMIPHDWVVELCDVVMGNRCNDEEIYLALEGRVCGEVDAGVNDSFPKGFSISA